MVVDDWVDVHDYEQVVWQLGANVDPARDVAALDRARSTSSTTRPNLAASAARSASTRRATWAERGLPARVARGRPHVGRRRASGSTRAGPSSESNSVAVTTMRRRVRRRAGAGSSAREVRDVETAIAVRSRAGLCAVCSHVDTCPTADAECRCQLLWRRMSRVADPSGSHTGHDAAEGAAGAYVDPASARAAVSRGRFLTGVTLGLGGPDRRRHDRPGHRLRARAVVLRRGLVLDRPRPDRPVHATSTRPSSTSAGRSATSTAASPSCARRRTARSPRLATPACTSAARSS